jgi:hypothetical protein
MGIHYPYRVCSMNCTLDDDHPTRKLDFYIYKKSPFLGRVTDIGFLLS